MPGAFDPSLLALQPQSLGALRYAAKRDSEASMRQVAQQFESMFVGILMKSMRAATPSDSPFDNEQTRLYTELQDQQVAQKIATTGKGLGLADMLLAQMKRNSGTADTTQAPGQPIPLKPEAHAIPFKHDQSLIPLKTSLPGSDMMPLNMPYTRSGS